MIKIEEDNINSNQMADEGFVISNDASSRVVAHDIIKSRGTLHPKLTNRLYSFSKAAALVANNESSTFPHSTSFHVSIGQNIQIELTPNMTIHPPLKRISEDCSNFFIQNEERKTLHLKFEDNGVLLKWHKALREVGSVRFVIRMSFCYS